MVSTEEGRLPGSSADVSRISRGMVRGIDGDDVVEASQAAEEEIVSEARRCHSRDLRESPG